MINRKQLYLSILIISVLSTSLFGIFYLRNDQDSIKLKILFENDADLNNPYGVILVNPVKHPQTKLNQAAEFVKWLIGDDGQIIIKDYEFHGQQLFTPSFNWTALSGTEKAFWEGIEVGKSEDVTIRLATTTSARDSGLLDYLLPLFYQMSKIRIEVIAVGTGAALDTAKQGNVDLVIVHARKLEDQFVADGYGIHRIDLMYNDFVVIGPENDPALISTALNTGHAFKKIFDSHSKFISRGDNSGTHNKELAIWEKANISILSDDFTWVKNHPWYIESGTGMSETIIIAFEKKGYTLTDRATWIKVSINSNLS